MMAAFGEPTPFATAFGKAGAIAGRNIKEYEKLKRESDLKANQIRLDTARYERAEKRGNIKEANTFADRIEKNKLDLYSLQAGQKQAITALSGKQAEMAQAKDLAEKNLDIQRQQLAVTRAGQFNLDRDFLNIETQKGVEDYRARTGKDPVGKDLADIRSAAVTKVAETKRYNPYGASNIDIRTQSEITDRIKGDPEMKRLENTLEIAGYKKDNQAEITALTAQMNARRQVLIDEVTKGVKPTPGVPTTTTTPPPATTQSLQPGQIVVDANGNRAKYVGGDPKDPKSYAPV
jgi:hypothetical protein